MKKILIFVTLLPLILCAQVKVVSSPKQEEKEMVFKYDSLSNFPGYYRITGFRGQELFLLPRPDYLKKYGYTDIYRDSDNHSGNIPVDEIGGHTFIVTDVVKKDYSCDLRLLDKETAIAYYYSLSFWQKSWNFITLGYKAKYEAENKGKKFVYLSVAFCKDLNTGNRISKSRGSVWTFQEIVANGEREEMGYTFTNDEGETMLATEYDFKSFIPKSKIDKYIRKYGKKMCDLAIGGKIRIGMPADLVKIAYGEPRSINRASYGEQWVYGEYGDDCVYFRNGKVTAWN